MRPLSLLLLFSSLLAYLPSLVQAAQSVPDITGVWERTKDAAAMPSQSPQLKPQYQQQRQKMLQAVNEANSKGEPLATRLMQCQGDGMPGMMGGPFPMEILQSRGQVTIIQEAYTQVRRIYLDMSQTPIDEVEPSFYGHSVGHWVGDALLVETVGIKEEVTYQSMPHSSQMRIREKIYFATQDILRDEITIEDPLVLERPWTYTMSYRRIPEYQMLEYVCEGNRYYVDEQGRQRIFLETSDR